MSTRLLYLHNKVNRTNRHLRRYLARSRDGPFQIAGHNSRHDLPAGLVFIGYFLHLFWSKESPNLQRPIVLNTVDEQDTSQFSVPTSKRLAFSSVLLHHTQYFDFHLVSHLRAELSQETHWQLIISSMDPSPYAIVACPQKRCLSSGRWDWL